MGIYRPIIAELHDLAIQHRWLDAEVLMPSDKEIEDIRQRQETAPPPHLLTPYHEQLKQWDAEGLSSIVIQRLLHEKCPCDVQIIRRYPPKHFPIPI